MVKVKCLAQASHTVLDKWAATAQRLWVHSMMGEYQATIRQKNTQPTLDTTRRLPKLARTDAEPKSNVEIRCYGNGKQMEIGCRAIGAEAEVLL